MDSPNDAADQLDKIRAILDPILDPVTPEATPDELREAIIAIVAVVHPRRAIYAPRRQ